MHIRHSFDLRLFGQSLKRIGTALKDAGGDRPGQIDPTDEPADSAQAPDPASTAFPADQAEQYDQLQRTALLTRLAIDLRAATDPALIAHSVLGAISLHSDAGTAMIVLAGTDGRIELALSNSGGQPQPMPLEQARRLLEHGPVGWEWCDGSSVLLSNDAHDLSWGGNGESTPFGSIIALPLAHGSASFGTLMISHPLPGRFSSQDLLLFEGVAAQAGLALGSARQEERRQRDRPLFGQERQSIYNSDPMHIIFDHLPDGLLLLDPAGRILIANDAFCEDVLGLPPRAVIGRAYAAVIQEVEHTDQIRIEPHPSIPALRRARCAGADEQPRWYEIDRYSMAGGDGAEQLIERWRDITRQEEQRRELLHDEQLTTMARMAAKVVHEIGNPLQSVRSCIDLSREDRTLAGSTAEYLELASNELRRMSHILSQLRSLYRLPLNEANHE